MLLVELMLLPGRPDESLCHCRVLAGGTEEQRTETETEVVALVSCCFFWHGIILVFAFQWTGLFVLTTHPPLNTSMMNCEWNRTAFHSLHILIMCGAMTSNQWVNYESALLCSSLGRESDGAFAPTPSQRDQVWLWGLFLSETNTRNILWSEVRFVALWKEAGCSFGRSVEWITLCSIKPILGCMGHPAISVPSVLPPSCAVWKASERKFWQRSMSHHLIIY